MIWRHDQMEETIASPSSMVANLKMSAEGVSTARRSAAEVAFCLIGRKSGVACSNTDQVEGLDL